MATDPLRLEMLDRWDNLQAKKEAVLQRTRPLRRKMQEIQLQILDLNKQRVELAEQVRPIEERELAPLDQAIAGVCRALKGKTKRAPHEKNPSREETVR